MYHVGAEYVGDEDLKYFTSQGVKLENGIDSGNPEEIRKMYDEDAYAQELYKQVHKYYETFDLGTVAANAKGFSTGAIYSMAFIGASGTGKSTAARVLPTRCGLPYVSVNFSVNIEEADLFGAMVPNPKKKSADDPEFIWQDGIVTRAVRNGYCAILEEINFARPGVLGKLNSLLDENRQIDLSNGEIVKAHPNFRMIATCNIAYEGTNRFNKALINRFDDVTVFKDPEREAAIKIIKERTGYSNTTKLARIYDVYEALKKFVKEQGIDAVVSMRQLLNIFTKGKYYKDAKDAVKRIILNGAFIEDAEYQAAFEETVLPAFDLKFKI
jgi:MoxR-like ATPase